MDVLDGNVAKEVRPKLFKVAPLTASICWLFVLINIFVSYSLYDVYRPTTKLLFVNNFLNFQVWGIFFAALAVLGTVNLLRNDWNMIRRTLLFGITVKAAWEITLVIRTLQNPKATILITVLWGFFLLVQVATYIFFLPEITVGKDNEQQSKQ